MNVFSKSLAILAMVAWVGVAQAEEKAADKSADKSANKTENTADDAQKAAGKQAGDKAADKQADKKAGNKGKGVRGTVLKIDGLALTVSAKGAGGVMQETVVTTDDKTIIVLDGKEGGKLSDLKQGQQVMVMAAEGDKPARIEAKTAKPKGDSAEKKEGAKKEKSPESN